jgi:dihydroflavonol-4-reductase
MELGPGAWAGRRVCVTGGTGFLGSHLVRALVGLGADVTVLALPPRSGTAVPLPNEIDLIYGDIRDAGAVRRAVAGCSLVFHTAGLVAVWGPDLGLLDAVHCDGTRNVLALAPPGARVVHTSSIVAVGASRTQRPVDEDSPFTLDHAGLSYVRAKRAAEALALEAAAAGRDVVVTNPTYLVGPDDFEGSVMGRFCQRVWKGRLPLAPPGGVNLADVRDVAAGHLLAAEQGRAGRRYILGGEDHTFAVLIRLLARAAGCRPWTTPRVPGWAVTAVAGLAELRALLTGREPYPSFGHVRLNRYYWFASSDRARRELGYHARPLRETLTDAYHWHQGREPYILRGLNRWWMRPRRAA